MKFTPRAIKENVNISKTHPLKEFFVLLGGILGVLLAIYLVLGLVLDVLVERLPAETEKAIGNFLRRAYHSDRRYSAKEAVLQEILGGLAEYMPGDNYKFTAHIMDSRQVNAVALPGGHILVYSGLLDKVQTENELAMVLAHELGHYAHRDHLKRLGRGLVLVVISGFTTGIDSSLTEFLMRALLTTDYKFSRQQEVAADKFALRLLYNKYGHVGGATSFFRYIKDAPRIFKFFSTHPLSLERISLLEKEIEKNGYEIKEEVALKLR